MEQNEGRKQITIKALEGYCAFVTLAKREADLLEDQSGSLAARLASPERLSQYLLERDAITAYINAIADPLVKRWLSLRVYERLPWAEIASCHGYGNGTESVKKACLRYIQRNSKVKP